MYSTFDIARMAGCSYRQLDYWIRACVIVPEVDAKGAGTKRRFRPDQARVVRLVTDLAALGAKGIVLRRAAVCAERISDWTGIAYVDDEGNVTYSPPGGSCWAVDLDECNGVMVQGVLVA